MMRMQFGVFLLTAAPMAACAAERVGTCGDGVVDPGEGCDAEGEGCDAACHLTGAAAWKITVGDGSTMTRLLAAGVDATGQIVVLGESMDGPSTAGEAGAAWRLFVLALDPSGAQLWKTVLPDQERPELFAPHLAVVADGSIAVQAMDLHGLTAEGVPSWHVSADLYTAVAADADAVYVAGVGWNGPPVLQRLDPATGQPSWRRDLETAAGRIPRALAVTGDDLVLVGDWLSGEEEFSTWRVVVDTRTGDSGPLTSEARSTGDSEMSLAALPSGDLVLGEHLGDLNWRVRRMDLDGAVRWDVPVDFGEVDYLRGLAVAADETIVLVGADVVDLEERGHVRAIDGDGALLWNTVYQRGTEIPSGAAAGPGFVVLVGAERVDGTSVRGWARRLGPP